MDEGVLSPDGAAGAAIAGWLLSEGRRIAAPEELLDQLCRRLLDGLARLPGVTVRGIADPVGTLTVVFQVPSTVGATPRRNDRPSPARGRRTARAR